MEKLSIFISVLSFAVACAALYFSQLRKGKVVPIIGPQMTIYHHDFHAGMSTGVILPMSFLNDSPSTGNVIRASIAIQKFDKSEEAYYMQWQKFEVHNDKENKWDHESDAHPLVITPRSGIHKNVWMMWHAFNQRKLILEKGKYTLTVYLWGNDSKKPYKYKKEFFINAEQEQILNHNKKNQLTAGIYVQIDKELEINKLLSESELMNLL
ncbi:hypothetical protein [Aliivibrio logei]|uniref:hypothetical protein n=1 Tax=Aliivibrio logei TaxID=688 RepID=UPI0003A298B9|nr:hypothetical protein [Aliivibrio logei]